MSEEEENVTRPEERKASGELEAPDLLAQDEKLNTITEKHPASIFEIVLISPAIDFIAVAEWCISLGVSLG